MHPLPCLPPLLLALPSDLQGKPAVLLGFAVAAAFVVMAGIKLSAYGDALGERTGLGAGLIGLLFLAAVTSLPELVVSTTSTIMASIQALGLDPRAFADTAAFRARRMLIWRGGADLAIGNMIGSNVVNLMLFAVMDLVQGQGAFIFRLGRSHVMSAASGLGLLGILLFGFALCNASLHGTGLVIPFLQVGPVTPLLFVGYLLAMLLQGKHERSGGEAAQQDDNGRQSPADPRLVRMPGSRFYATLLLLAACIVGGGMALSVLGDRMAVLFDLGQSFVGTVFLAISTSLPELVVCIAAVRLGSYDMAVGNVLGSNIFNLVIIFTADIGLRGASLLHCASPAHLVTMGMCLLLTSIVIVSLVYRSQRSFARLGLDVWLMLAVYVVGNIALYHVR